MFAVIFWTPTVFFSVLQYVFTQSFIHTLKNELVSVKKEKEYFRATHATSESSNMMDNAQ